MLLISCSRSLRGLIYGETVNASCAAARCCIRAVLVLVRRVPRRQSPGGALTGPIPSECPTCPMADAESDVQSAHVWPEASVPSAFDPVRMSCSFGVGRAGPLAIDTPPAFVKEQRRITGARVKFGEIIRDQLQVDVVPGPLPNPIFGVRHLIGKL